MSQKLEWLLAAALALGLQAAAPPQQGSDAGTVVPFPEAGLAIARPDGFEKAKAFYGFQQPSTGSSIMLSSMPGPFSEIAKGLDEKKLAAKGMTVHSKTSVKVQGEPGWLLHIAQSAYGRTYLKWVLVFGDENRTNMITATFPKAHADKLSELLKKVVLGAVAIESPDQEAAKLPFTIQPAEGLVPIKKLSAMGKMAAFAKNGDIPTPSPGEPMFFVAPSLGDIPVADPKRFAVRRLHAIGTVDIESIQSIHPVVIDGLHGFEIVAAGKDQRTKTPLVAYQVMLFPKGGGYVLMAGLVGDQQAGVYLPKFKAMAKTYKKSPD